MATAVKEIIHVGPVEIRFLLESKDTAGAISMFEFLVPSGARVPAPHYHESFDEIAYGLEGVLTFTISGQAIELRPGETCFIPRGAVHQFVNTGPERTRTLSVITPALLGPEYFRELAALLAAGAPAPAAIAEIMRRHGLVVVPPKG